MLMYVCMDYLKIMMAGTLRNGHAKEAGLNSFCNKNVSAWSTYIHARPEILTYMHVHS
jgi:hypothetical protein